MSGKSMHRRKMLKLTAAGVCATFVPTALAGSSRESARLLMSYKGRSMGIKMTKIDGGRMIVTVREIEGEHLTIIVAEPLKNSENQKIAVTLKSGETHHVYTHSSKERAAAPFSTDIPGLEIGAIEYSGAKSKDDGGPGESSEGLFSFLKQVAHDIGTAIAGAAALITGGGGTFKFSWGGVLQVYSFGNGFRWTPGSFKLEPGMEEDPTVWY